MVIRKTCLYKYKMNKVKHYPILSQTCIHFSVQTTPVQFNWSISKTCSWFTCFLLLLSVPYYGHILPIYLHICHIYVGPNSTYMYQSHTLPIYLLGLSTSNRLTVERTEYRLVKLVLGYSVKRKYIKQNVANIKICSVWLFVLFVLRDGTLFWQVINNYGMSSTAPGYYRSIVCTCHWIGVYI